MPPCVYDRNDIQIIWSYIGYTCFLFVDIAWHCWCLMISAQRSTCCRLVPRNTVMTWEFAGLFQMAQWKWLIYADLWWFYLWKMMISYDINDFFMLHCCILVYQRVSDSKIYKSTGSLRNARMIGEWGGMIWNSVEYCHLKSRAQISCCGWVCLLLVAPKAPYAETVRSWACLAEVNQLQAVETWTEKLGIPCSVIKHQGTLGTLW